MFEEKAELENLKLAFERSGLKKPKGPVRELNPGPRPP
jgi:hypothetical protein